jgi:hypothetical protein
MPLCKVLISGQLVHVMEKPQIRPICNMNMQLTAFLTSLSIASLGIVGISTGEIFPAHTIGVLVRPLDFKPPITITITITIEGGLSNFLLWD